MLRIVRTVMERTCAKICALPFLVLCSASFPALAGGAPPDTVPAAITSPDQSAATLPAILFRPDPSAGDLFDALRAAPEFAHLSKDAPGSPIQLRVYHTAHPSKMDAKNFFSGLASVGTLGLSPVIMSGEFTMHYEIYVNGQRISRHEYSKHLSRSEPSRGNTADPTHGLGPDGAIWAKSTVDQFLKDVAGDESMRALVDEYQAYFGALAPASSAAATPP
jgi:hypothetical protein